MDAKEISSDRYMEFRLRFYTHARYVHKVNGRIDGGSST